MNFIIDLQVYPFDIMFSVCETDEAFKKNYKSASGKEPDESMLNVERDVKGRTYMNEDHALLIRIFEKGDTPKSRGVVSHEIFHAIQMIMQRIGMMELCFANCEAYAYAIQYVTELYYANIAMQKKVNKKQTRKK